MPLKLDTLTIDRGLGIPAYQQLANHLRQAIITGDVQPGDTLPSAKDIKQLTGISREPVLRALDVLRGEGLVNPPRPGFLATVAQPRRPRLMGPARYRDLLGHLRRGEPLPPENAFTIENGAKWRDYTEDPREFNAEAVSGLDRELLQIEDAELWRRRFVRRLWGKPFEIVRSAVPLDIAAGTLLTDPDAEPTPGGTIEVLFNAGYDPQLARHTVVGRAPNARERELLELKPADWVYDLLEVFTDRDGRRIQAARTILPMAGAVLEFETDLSAG